MTRLFRILLLLCLIPATQAAQFNVGLLHGADDIYDYELSVIRLALKHASGNHSMEIIPMEEVTQKRIFALLREGDGEINTFFSGYSPERERHFLQVDIPMTRGLLGYRLFLTDKDRVDDLGRLDSLEALQQYRVGSGLGWPDNPILRYNGLQLVTSQYKNLWRMLDFGRFELFHRGMQEIFTELKNQPKVTVVPDVGIAFRFDYFLYVSPTRPDLHQILTEGLTNAYQSGAFMDHFRNHPRIKEALERSLLTERHIIRLELPEAFRSLESIPQHYWHQARTEPAIPVREPGFDPQAGY